MPAWVGLGPTVEVSVSLGHTDGQRLHRFYFVRALLQQNGTHGGVVRWLGGVVGWLGGVVCRGAVSWRRGGIRGYRAIRRGRSMVGWLRRMVGRFRRMVGGFRGVVGGLGCMLLGCMLLGCMVGGGLRVVLRPQLEYGCVAWGVGGGGGDQLVGVKDRVKGKIRGKVIEIWEV